MGRLVRKPGSTQGHSGSDSVKKKKNYKNNKTTNAATPMVQCSLTLKYKNMLFVCPPRPLFLGYVVHLWRVETTVALSNQVNSA